MYSQDFAWGIGLKIVIPPWQNNQYWQRCKWSEALSVFWRSWASTAHEHIILLCLLCAVPALWKNPNPESFLQGNEDLVDFPRLLDQEVK